MYNINYNNLKKGYKFHSKFLVIGIIIFLIVSTIIFQNVIKRKFMNGEVKAYYVKINKSIIKDENTLYRVTYYYMVNGKEYIYTIPVSDVTEISKLQTQNTIYYENSNPSNCISEYECTITATNIFIILSFSTVPLFGLIGIFSIKRRINKVRWLAKNGTLIKGLKYRLVRN